MQHKKIIEGVVSEPKAAIKSLSNVYGKNPGRLQLILKLYEVKPGGRQEVGRGAPRVGFCFA